MCLPGPPRAVPPGIPPTDPLPDDAPDAVIRCTSRLAILHHLDKQERRSLPDTEDMTDY